MQQIFQSARRPLAIATAAAFMTALTMVPAYTQAADSDKKEDGSELEEVLVTAQRRAQDLQDVAIAITALGGDEIRASDIHNGTEIAARVPGMQYAEFAPGQALFAIRGVTSADDGAGMDNSVALFLDDVYIGRAASINFDLVDLERIEVLRGPQGTLYGKNAIGGAINIITQKPDDTFHAKVELTAGSEGTFNVNAALNGPLGENLAGKLVVSSRKHDGYVRNIILDKDQQDEDTQTIRGQLRWDNDQTDITLSADSMKEDREDMGRRPIADNSAPALAIFASVGGDFRHVAAPIDGYSERSGGGFSINANHETDAGTLSVVAAVRDAETDWEMASVGIPLIGGAGDVMDEIHEDIDQTQLEIRWAGDIGENITYVSGFFYLNEQTDRIEHFRVDIPGAGTVAQDNADQNNETDSWALFGQLTWQINDQWAVDLGARYTEEEKETHSDMVSGGFGIIGETFVADASGSWSDLSPKVAVTFQPSDELTLYGSIAEGFKSGGFQGAPSSLENATTPVDPETAINYEFGIKSILADNSLRLNAAIFYTDYTDLQIVRFGPPLDAPEEFGGFTTSNAADAELQGIELDFVWLVSEQFTISGNYAYLDTEFKDFIFYDRSNVAIDLSGQELRQAPGSSYNFVFDYEQPLEFGGTLAYRLDFRHMDESFNDVIDERVINGEHDLVDARVALLSADESWEVALWGKNLTDEEYITHAYTVGPAVVGIGNAPRTFGLTFSYNFR